MKGAARRSGPRPSAVARVERRSRARGAPRPRNEGAVRGSDRDPEL